MSREQDCDLECFQGAGDENHTFPTAAGDLKVGDHVCINKRPARIIEVVHIKNGKHGACKVALEALDVFTGRKYVASAPGSAMLPCPVVKKTEFMLIDIIDDSQLSLLSDDNEQRQDLNLPLDEEMRGRIIAHFNAGRGLNVMVLSAMGEEQVCAFKVDGR